MGLGIIKKAVVEQQRTSVIAYVALGISIVSLLCVIGLVASNGD
jgi:hypothetical protein